MKVLITTLNSKYIHSCLSIKYIARALRAFGDVEVREYTINEDIDRILSSLVQGNHEVVGFSCYIWNIESVLRICKNLRKIRPDLKIFLGGPEVSYDAESLLEKHPYIDHVIAGEGELSVSEYLRALSGEIGFEEVQGLRWRRREADGRERIIANGSPVVLPDLSVVKSPYEEACEEEIRNKIVYYETSRGCVYNCSYCLSSVTKGVRFFPMPQVKEDIRKLVAMGAKQIKFVDRTFNVEPKRTMELICFLKEVDDGKINFHFEITAHLLTDVLIEELAEAREGLFQLEIGVQSTNPLTLSSICRQDRFELLAQNVKKLQKKGNIHQHLDLIAGLPAENLSSFRKSFQDVYGLFPDMLQLGFLKLLKGTPIREQAERHGYVFRDYPPYEILENRYISAEELFHLKEVEEMVDRFYNSSLFHYGIRYLSDFYREDYMRLYEELGELHRARFDGEKLSRDDNYFLLFIFGDSLKGNPAYNEGLFRELLRFDYLRMGRTRVLPEFLRNEREFLSKEEGLDFLRRKSVRAAFRMEEMHLFEMAKKVAVYDFHYDLMEYIRYKQILETGCLIAFDYSGRRDIHGKVPFAGERRRL